jgi:hypothetical protein
MISQQAIDTALFAFALIVSFSISYMQTRTLAGRGSDHQVHLFLINLIRENSHRLLSRIPRLLNESYCGAYPLFLHWLLSFLSLRQINIVALLFNPLMNVVQVVILYIALKQEFVVGSGLSAMAGAISLCVALTPQFFHILSARNKGFSSRPVGLILLTVCALLVYCVGGTSYPRLFFALAVLATYLIWGFNTFAQQAVILFGSILGVVFGNWTLLLVAATSLIFFVLLHPRYAFSYLKHTSIFIKTYATDLADVFILKLRPSIWRDLVYDIWNRMLKAPKKALAYAYGNSFLIVIFLNPFVFVAVYSAWRGNLANPFIMFCSQMAAAGLIVFVLTSFRRTRFLGEPERYVELVTAFSTTSGAWYLYSLFGLQGVLAVLIYFFFANVSQFFLARWMIHGTKETASNFTLVEAAITREFKGEPVRFASNNEELTRSLMTNAWSFVLLVWSVGQNYGAELSVGQAFSTFPYLRQRAFEVILNRFGVNALLLDKSNFSEVFENSRSDRERLELLLETEQLRLYRLREQLAYCEEKPLISVLAGSSDSDLHGVPV